MRFGIIGTGRIARRFIPECLAVSGADIKAVFNPHEGRAEQFIKECFGTVEGADGERSVPEGFSDISGLWGSVDAVYIASPHETHFSYIAAALDHGKHVLCEKPMVLSKKQAENAYKKAEDRGLILMEGIKTAFCPGYKKVLELAMGGIIGDVKLVEACFTKLEKKDSRELNDKAFGGSFTELGSYVMLPVFDILGYEERRVSFDSITDDRGLDIFTKCDISYPDALASLSCGLGVKSEGRLLIGGTLGFIVVTAPWWKTSHIEVHFEDPSKVMEYETEFEGDGLRYEIEEFIRAAEGDKGAVPCGAGVLPRGSYDHRKSSVAMADLMERFLLKRRPESGTVSGDDPCGT